MIESTRIYYESIMSAERNVPALPHIYKFLTSLKHIFQLETRKTLKAWHTEIKNNERKTIT